MGPRVREDDVLLLVPQPFYDSRVREDDVEVPILD